MLSILQNKTGQRSSIYDIAATSRMYSTAVFMYIRGFQFKQPRGHSGVSSNKKANA